MTKLTNDVDRVAWSLVKSALPHLTRLVAGTSAGFARRLYVQIRDLLREDHTLNSDTATVEALSMATFAVLLSDGHPVEPALLSSLRRSWAKCLEDEIGITGNGSALDSRRPNQSPDLEEPPASTSDDEV
jgi:hypothetical protein